MSRRRWSFVSSTFNALLTAGVFLLLAAATAQAKSGCVTCHTDEDMLEENLAKVQAKKSAKQAGAG